MVQGEGMTTEGRSPASTPTDVEREKETPAHLFNVP